MALAAPDFLAGEPVFAAAGRAVEREAPEDLGIAFAAFARAPAPRDEREAPDDFAEAERLDAEVDFAFFAFFALGLALDFAAGLELDLEPRAVDPRELRTLLDAPRAFALDREPDAFRFALPELFRFPLLAAFPAAFFFFLATPLLPLRAFAGARIIQFRRWRIETESAS